MKCRLLSDIKHKCEYNSGGVSQLLLLDIDDFKTYRFLDDGLYDTCYIERIRVKRTGYIEFDIENETNFTEKNENGIYIQSLSTYIRGLDAEKTSQLLLATKHTYLVVFVTNTGRIFSFGSDGGASVSFSQATGKIGEVEGYTITIEKKSIYPLFEADTNALKVYLLGTEDKANFITSEDLENLFEIDGYEHK